MATKSFFVTKNLPEKFFKNISKKFPMEMWPNSNEEIPRQKLLERVSGKTGLLCTLSDRIDRQLLDAAGPQLKCISTLSVGYDHIDIDECKRRGIVVGNTPDVLTDTVAELTIALLLATIRRLFEANQALRQGKWPAGWGHFFMCGSMIKGSHIGVIGGSGRIGRSVIKRLRSFEPAKISYTSRQEYPEMFREFNAEFYPLDRLLIESDIIIVCCSLNDSTRRLISTEQFKRMKSTSVIINTSRGSCIDQQALYEALKSRKIAAAGLDVYEQEPISMDDPLLSLDNVVLLPHIGSAAKSTREQMIQMALDNLEAGLEDRPLLASV
ncbi:glyoxylate reductase/hydroxypyruvate reductase [Dermatophagoides pteronyssinus]|uniref:glyoxylate reductase/hydroxypyruvate reductase n=1 Tax=Dermatophagoides pteronyssinus TaxID=6956 RepID=UPI003F673C73